MAPARRGSSLRQQLVDKLCLSDSCDAVDHGQGSIFQQGLHPLQLGLATDKAADGLRK